MRLICENCDSSDFSTIETKSEDINYLTGIGTIIKDLECDGCGHIQRRVLAIEITNEI